MWWLSVFSLQALAVEGLPLESTTFDVDVSGPYADITIEQTFSNPNVEYLEATYTFPLHAEAAVDGMEMRMGDRVVRSEVKLRDEAREEFERAREEGHAAALTEQERPNVFTQSVTNIPPGEKVVVKLHLTQPMTWLDGSWQLQLPLTVGPRFQPSSASVEPMVDPLISTGATGNKVDIHVRWDMGTEIAAVTSPTHEIAPRGDELTLRGIAADRDFVLDLDPVDGEPVSSLLVEGDHFALTLEPPETPRADQIAPRELVFVIDTSCSQSGKPMELSKELMEEALENLRPSDTFKLLNFSSTVAELSPDPLPATPANLARGLAYVEGLDADGGTMLLDGMLAALDAPIDPERKRVVVFLTDGYVGNETEILGALEDHLGSSRMFTFGVGGSVNRYLIDGMAEVGRGFSQEVLLETPTEEAVEAFYSRIATPVLTDVELDFGAADVSGVYPKRLPDVFAGYPIRAVGRFEGDLSTVTVRGKLGGKPWSRKVAVEAVDDGTAIGATWARQRIKSLEMEQNFGEVPEVRAEIEKTALDYHLLSRYTSMLAVEYRVTRTGELVAVEQPSECPAGVDCTRAAELSRLYTPPGDPVFSVPAPENAVEVTVIYPWGEVASMQWDELRQRWYHRFLVPRDWPDGPVEVTAHVLMPDGSLEEWSEILTVDSQKPEIEAELEVEDGITRVTVRLEEPLRSLILTPVGAPELEVRLNLRNDDREEIVVEFPGTWDQVELVAKDRAMNRISETVE